MNSTRIGDIGVAHVIAKCLEKNISVFVPFGDNERVDLIILLDNIPKKVQVKTTNKDVNNVSVFNITSCTSAIYNRKSMVRKYTKDEIDYYMLYNIARDEIYMVPFEDASDVQITIRHVKTKNNQSKNIKMASDYLF